MRIGILISGNGSNMLALVRAMRAGGIPAEPAVVVSNRREAAGLARAAAEGVPTETVPHADFADRTAFDAALDARLRAHGCDAVACAGFLRVMTARMTGSWAGRMLNIHPALLPLFPGLDTHRRALEAGVAIHGATVHLVTETVDAGPILGQAAVPVRAGDTAETLGARVLAAEHRLYPAVLARFAADPERADAAPLALFPEDMP